jgi:hypothetical protein
MANIMYPLGIGHRDDGRIWVNIPQTGYVGVGIVKQGPVLAKEFMLDENDDKAISILELPLQGNFTRPSDNAPDKDEYLVRVEWIKTVPIQEAIKEKGYVLNVVYSCGTIIHNNELVIPYAMSDIDSGIATVSVNELLSCMRTVQ